MQTEKLNRKILKQSLRDGLANAISALKLAIPPKKMEKLLDKIAKGASSEIYHAEKKARKKQKKQSEKIKSVEKILGGKTNDSKEGKKAKVWKKVVIV